MGFVGLLLALTQQIVKNPSTMLTIIRIMYMRRSLLALSLRMKATATLCKRAHDAAMHL